jgi:uncharacterized protein YqeY
MAWDVEVQSQLREYARKLGVETCEEDADAVLAILAREVDQARERYQMFSKSYRAAASTEDKDRILSEYVAREPIPYLGTLALSVYGAGGGSYGSHGA